MSTRVKRDERMTSQACRICNNREGNHVHRAREMMFGTREPFDYLECAACGCLQLLDVPSDLSRFYPDNYYSLGQPGRSSDGTIAAAAKRARADLLLRLPARAVDALVLAQRVPGPFMWFAGLRLTRSSKICDVGSGSGQTLVWMQRQGFSRLAGFDPYIDGDHEVSDRISVRKLDVEDIPRGWDLIMLNHSFEHMSQPAEILQRLRDCLQDQGAIVIRVPVADSWAWRNYGVNWVQIDAPRHLFIHTQRSMSLLAESAGLTIARIFSDSYALQFWGSEQCRMDIPLRDPRSYAETRTTDLFSAARIRDFEQRSIALNRTREGDSVGFVLRPS
jgi:SAM-dependent methyltransferase